MHTRRATTNVGSYLELRDDIQARFDHLCALHDPSLGVFESLLVAGLRLEAGMADIANEFF